jgi:hypothetical protein
MKAAGSPRNQACEPRLCQSDLAADGQAVLEREKSRLASLWFVGRSFHEMRFNLAPNGAHLAPICWKKMPIGNAFIYRIR